MLRDLNFIDCRERGRGAGNSKISIFLSDLYSLSVQNFTSLKTGTGGGDLGSVFM